MADADLSVPQSARAFLLSARRSSPWRVLVLNHDVPPVGGGASPVADGMAKAYVNRGHSVSVVTMHHGGLPSVEVRDGVRIFRIRCMRHRRHICTVPEMVSFVLSARWFLTA